MLLDQIPGYKKAMAAAERREQDLRDAAFLDIPLEICGVPVVPLTLRRMLLLYAVGNPWFAGGSIGPEHVAQFLWIVSPEYIPFDGVTRTAFTDLIGGVVSYDAGCREIDRYLEAMLMDQPGSGGRGGPRITSFVASYIDIFASEYRWDDDLILDKPLPRLFQYLRRIERRRDPESPVHNRYSDRTRRRVVKRHLKRLEAARG